jgi:hypothetical protein
METLPVKKDSRDRQNIIEGLSRNIRKWFGNPGREAVQDNSYAETVKPHLTTKGVFINCLI